MANSDGFNLFGFQIKRAKTKENWSVVPPVSDDGAVIGNSNAAYYGLVIDLEGIVKNENDLIRRYREISNYGDCDAAIEDIVNEAIVADSDKVVISIKLDELQLPDKIKDIIHDEFDNILRLLDFEEKCHDIFRQWYIDGRLFYNIILDPQNPKNGIVELRYVDPRKIRKIKNVKKDRDPKTGADVITSVEEYYLFNDKGITEQTSQGIKISMDSILYCHSGLIDYNTGMALSYLHSAIKPCNQLKVMEDATVIYRISRAPERRVFYIDVGNLPKLKAEQYVQEQMNKYRNKIVYDACLAMDTLIPLLDGRTLPLYEIQKEFEEGKQLWVYSCDPNTGKFAPGLVTSAGITRFNEQVMRITLDNGKTITCTLDHKFPVWNKGKVEAKDLVVGDSMIPLYRRENQISKIRQGKYEQVFDNESKDWKFTHRLVSKWKDDVQMDNVFIFNEDLCVDKKMTTIHHKNVNRFDNSPENLVRMHNKDHILYHQHIMTTDIARANFAKGRAMFAELMKDPDYKEWHRQRQKEGWTEEKRQKASIHASKRGLSAQGNLAQKEQWKTKERREEHHQKYAVAYSDEMFNVLNGCASKKMSNAKAVEVLNSHTELLEQWRELNQNKVLNSKQKTFDQFTKYDIDKIVKYNPNTKADTFGKLREQYHYRNHKIVKIEFLDERMDVGTLGIDKNEIYHDYHTFALDSGIYTCNSTGEVRDNRQHLSMLEDFWMPRRDSGKSTEITTLMGAQNLGNVEDVNYFQMKLYQSLRVPISRLQPQQGFSLGRSTEITREEVKFNKFIERLRRKFSSLFRDALRVQLITKGIIRPEEWDGMAPFIRFDYQRDNHFAELKNAEILMQRMQLLQQVDSYVGKYFSMQWIKENVLMQTEEDMKIINAQMQAEQPMILQQTAAMQQAQQGEAPE